MARAPPLAVVAALAVAGCASLADADEPVDATPTMRRIEGWVLDEAIRPVVNATATAVGANVTARTDDEGHYMLSLPLGQQVFITVEADGFIPKSAYLGGGGTRGVLNFSLVHLPTMEPFTLLTEHEGQLTCAVSAVVGQDDPSKPHEHVALRCYDVIPQEFDEGHLWSYVIPAQAQAVVVEMFWDKGTELAAALVLKIQVASTGDVVGFVEGTSPIRIQLAQLVVEQLHGLNNTELLLTVLPGAGTGNHEHGAVGVFFEQPFHIYATAFFHQPAPPTYSVAG